jgi:SEC-C motif-containing protein
MFPTKSLDRATSRLSGLLRDPATALHEAVTVARSVGLDLSGEVAAYLIHSAPARRKMDIPAIRAAQLARELRLAAAAPALVRCLERLPPAHPLHHVARTVVPHLGAAAVDALLPALERCGSSEVRVCLAEVLALTPVDDARIRTALVRMLDDDPSKAARFLADRCEWRALPDLVRTVERVLAEPLDCDICTGEALATLTLAVSVLGSALSPEQTGKIAEVLERAKASWTPVEPMFTLPDSLQEHAALGKRPGRNDPCPCGSGEKYKRCCLDADTRGTHGGASGNHPARRLN